MEDGNHGDALLFQLRQHIKHSGDAQKGAITDAIQKCMSLLSIGSDAYKGLLKNVCRQEKQQSTRKTGNGIQSAESPANPATLVNPTNTQADLPMIAGVNFEQHEGMVIAIGERLFDKKELLKAAGFQWDRAGKTWLKKAA